LCARGKVVKEAGKSGEQKDGQDPVKGRRMKKKLKIEMKAMKRKRRRKEEEEEEGRRKKMKKRQRRRKKRKVKRRRREPKKHHITSLRRLE